jgi:CheY-like chemotaxis protein
MAGDKERVLASGAKGYIEIPINPDTFISQLQEYFLP